jgi:hypothetical protein
VPESANSSPAPFATAATMFKIILSSSVTKATPKSRSESNHSARASDAGHSLAPPRNGDIAAQNRFYGMRT